jgi:hypothetical protein
MNRAIRLLAMLFIFLCLNGALVGGQYLFQTKDRTTMRALDAQIKNIDSQIERPMLKQESDTIDRENARINQYNMSEQKCMALIDADRTFRRNRQHSCVYEAIEMEKELTGEAGQNRALVDRYNKELAIADAMTTQRNSLARQYNILVDKGVGSYWYFIPIPAYHGSHIGD